MTCFDDDRYETDFSDIGLYPGPCPRAPLPPMHDMAAVATVAAVAAVATVVVIEGVFAVIKWLRE